MTRIVRNIIVAKKYKSIIEVLRFFFLYNTFRYHVKAIPVFTTLIYKYKKGPTLWELINQGVDYHELRLIMIDLARKLSKNHENYKILECNYSDVCGERNINHDSKFVSESYFFSKIHGDLNTRNIIIGSDNRVFFIDRLSHNGDMLFDFTFILSILCVYYKSGDSKYLFAVKDFFDIYDDALFQVVVKW